MKKKFVMYFLSVIIVLCCCSCITTFDTQNLQPNEYKLTNKLPNLEIISGDNTVSVGSTDSVSTSSYFYTVFKRELENNILDTTTDKKGSIEMVLIYNNIDWDIWWGLNHILTIEFDINIYNNNKELIWKNTYTDKLSFSKVFDFYDVGNINTQTLTLEHKLIDMFKMDVEKDYDLICEKLK